VALCPALPLCKAWRVRPVSCGLVGSRCRPSAGVGVQTARHRPRPQPGPAGNARTGSTWAETAARRVARGRTSSSREATARRPVRQAGHLQQVARPVGVHMVTRFGRPGRGQSRGRTESVQLGGQPRPSREGLDQKGAVPFVRPGDGQGGTRDAGRRAPHLLEWSDRASAQAAARVPAQPAGKPGWQH